MDKIKTLYLLVGDPFLAEERRREIAHALHNTYPDTLAESLHDLAETKIGSLMAQARSLPFGIDAQLFIVRNADEMKEADVELAGRYFESPSRSAYFILEAESLEKRSALAKLAGEYGEAVFFDARQKRPASAKFIQRKLKEHGKTIAPDALNRLDEQTGSMPVFLDSILEQLIRYAGDQPRITYEMVELFEENWQEIDVFSLANAVAGRQTERALILLKQVMESQDDVIGLLGLLHWQVRRLWQGKYLTEHGYSESAMLAECKISPKQAHYFLRQIKMFSLKKLEEALEGLFQIDWKIKTGRAEGPMELESWVLQTTG